jgi:hypothetical protein
VQRRRGSLHDSEGHEAGLNGADWRQFRYGPLELVGEGFRATLFLGAAVERELKKQVNQTVIRQKFQRQQPKKLSLAFAQRPCPTSRWSPKDLGNTR